MVSRSVQIIGGTGGRKFVEVDESSNALVVTDAGGISNLIQRGLTFQVTRFVTDLLPGAQETDILLQTGTSDLNLKMTVSVESDANLLLYETPTTSADGTALSAINRNRTSALVTGATWTHTPTVSAVGTELATWYVLAHDRMVQEWLLAPSTKYLIRLTSIAGHDAVDLGLEFDYYEPGLA